MKPVAWMIGASVASWLAAVVLLGAGTAVAVLFGMIGPLAVAAITWTLMERTYRTRPERLTSVMIAAFGAKMLFFGMYVAVMVRVLELRPVPFVASFTSYFIGLHAMEALCLRRLFANGGS